jgi:hypothetical protein
MVTPTFTGLDVGLPGGALATAGTANSVCAVDTGDLDVASVDYSFVGFSGLFRRVLGARGRNVVWRLALRCSTLAIMNQIIADAETAKRNGDAGELVTSDDRTFTTAIVTGVQPAGRVDTIRGGAMNGWVRREVNITFLVLSGQVPIPD